MVTCYFFRAKTRPATRAVQGDLKLLNMTNAKNKFLRLLLQPMSHTIKGFVQFLVELLSKLDIFKFFLVCQMAFIVLITV